MFLCQKLQQIQKQNSQRKRNALPESFTTPAAQGLSLHNYARNFELKNIQRFQWPRIIITLFIHREWLIAKVRKLQMLLVRKHIFRLKNQWTKSFIGVDDHIPFEKFNKMASPLAKGFLVFYLTFSLQAV